MKATSQEMLDEEFDPSDSDFDLGEDDDDPDSNEAVPPSGATFTISTGTVDGPKAGLNIERGGGDAVRGSASMLE